MTKCEVCGKEGNTFRCTFGETGIPAMTMCRTCNAKLMLSLPKDPKPENIVAAIDRLFESVKPAKKSYHSDSNNSTKRRSR